MNKYIICFLLIFNVLYADMENVSTHLDMVLIDPQSSDIQPFWVGKTPVIQNVFYEVMGSNPSAFKGDNLPVERISWYEAIAFCNLLSVTHGLDPVYIYHATYRQDDEGSKDVYDWIRGWGGIPPYRVATWNAIMVDPDADGYRLLTGTEWTHLYHNMVSQGSGLYDGSLENIAWTHVNSEGKTHPVATKQVDSNGLYDFLGNVREWLYDDGGNISENFFVYNTPEQESFYSSLGFRKFRNRDFLIVRNERGFYPVTRNPLIGLRVARNAASYQSSQSSLFWHHQPRMKTMFDKILECLDVCSFSCYDIAFIFNTNDVIETSQTAP